MPWKYNKRIKLKIKTYDAIKDSQLFLVLATSGYLEDLKDRNSDVYLQAKLAKIEKKPVFILYVKNKILSEEKIEIERFFSSYNVIKDIEIDFGSKKSEEQLKQALTDILHN